MRTMNCLLLFLVCFSSSFAVCQAWGRTGHELVGNLAWRLLSNSTRDAVKDVLATQPEVPSKKHDCPDCSPLGRIADWADQVRHTHAYAWSAPLHFIDVRDDKIPGGCPAGVGPDQCRFIYARDCVGDWCVAGAIVNYTKGLLGSDPVQVTESLKFVTHFIGDIHQPLHASRTTDRGGNSIHVQFPSAPPNDDQRVLRRWTNLHAVWDDSILERSIHYGFHQSKEAYEEHLWQSLSYYDEHPWLECADGALVDCVTAWGEESVDDAFTLAYANVDGSDIVNGTILDNDYHVTRLPVVEERLLMASVRLAVTLSLSLG